MAFLIAFCSILAITAILLVIYARWNYGFLEKLGIPVEPPTFMLGSCPDIYRRCPALEDIRRFKKYGPIFGVYEGRTPQILIADPELVKRIMVQDYEHFHSRAPIDLGHSISNEILDYLPDDRWKFTRSLLTPQLTSSKLKHIFGITNEIVCDFVKSLLEECTGERIEVDFRNRAIAVLVDIAATCLYGIELENRKEYNNDFMKMLKNILCEDVTYDFRYTLIQVFPFLKRIFRTWPFPTNGLEPFRRLMMEYVNQRRQRPGIKNVQQRRNDLGDVFVDMMNGVDTPEFQKVGFKPETAIAQVLEVFFATYDSTGTSLTMTMYHLSKHPEFQARVIEEVDTIFGKYDNELTPSALGEFTFLTACLNEAMRLNPPFIRPERSCTKDWVVEREYGRQLRIPKGANVLIPIWALHRHPDYFPDPEAFNPDRFMPENIQKMHPYSFATFGHGPKNCIGMKLAYNNMILILANIFREFRVEARADTKLQLKIGRLFVTQFEAIPFDFVKRY